MQQKVLRVKEMVNRENASKSSSVVGVVGVGVRCSIRDYVMCFWTVSYTHLTLPTIYSV